MSFYCGVPRFKAGCAASAGLVSNHVAVDRKPTGLVAQICFRRFYKCYPGSGRYCHTAIGIVNTSSDC